MRTTTTEPQQICKQNDCPLSSDPVGNCTCNAAAPGYTPISPRSATNLSTGSLSIGVQAGIGVGVSIVGMLLIALALYLLRHRSSAIRRMTSLKSRKVEPIDTQETASTSPPRAKPELEGDNALEAGSVQIHEMEGELEATRSSVTSS